MKGQLISWFVISFLTNIITEVCGDLETDISKKIVEKNNTILSRKRRYLVFPEGSSFQVVFDLTYPSVGMGNAFVFGHTAAMGWELPSTPIFVDKKKMPEEKEEKTENTNMKGSQENLQHSVDNEHDLHQWHPPQILVDSQEEYQDSVEWKHPEYSVPSTDYESTGTNIDRSPVIVYSNPFESNVKQNLPKRYTFADGEHPLRDYQKYKNPFDIWNLKRNNRQGPISNFATSFTNHMAPFRKTVTHHIHRRSRRELYTKIEKLFTALSKDGKACVLKAICQVNKVPKNKGSMWEEILKTIFKVKPNDHYPDEDHYDKAANPNHNCDEVYPECDGHVLSNIFRNKFSK